MEFFDKVQAQLGATGWALTAQVFGIVLATVIINVAYRVVLRRVRKTVAATNNPWDDAIINAVDRPMAVLIWVIGVASAAFVIGKGAQAAVFEAAVPLMSVSVVVIAAWFVIRLLKECEALLIDADETAVPTWDATTAQALGKLLRLCVIITATLVAMNSLGINVAGALAFGGIGGLAVGMAAKDLLANFFGGLMLYLDRPIAVGEWVRSPDKQIEGTVEEIGWRLSRIRTFDKRPLFIPNSLFTTMIVENPSRMSHRRIYETIGLRYDDIDHVEAICDDVRTMLQEHPEIDTGQTLMVQFNSFGASSLDFFVYTFTKTTVWADYHVVKQDVLQQIYAIIRRHGADIAFPTRTLHVEPVEVSQAAG